MKAWLGLRKDSLIRTFLKYFGLCFLLFVSLALAALLIMIREQSNPFFYANF